MCRPSAFCNFSLCREDFGFDSDAQNCGKVPRKGKRVTDTQEYSKGWVRARPTLPWQRWLPFHDCGTGLGSSLWIFDLTPEVATP